MCIGGQWIYITGNLAVEEVLIGSYNHGDFYSQSAVKCPVIISDDYTFNFAAADTVTILDTTDEEDQNSIEELLIEGLFEDNDDDKYFSFYTACDAIKAGRSLLLPVRELSPVTDADFIQLLESPLLGPGIPKLSFDEGDWYITLSKEYKDEDGELNPASLLAMNEETAEQYFWQLRPDGQIVTVLKHEEQWVGLSTVDAGYELQTLRCFSLIQRSIARKEKWNEKHKKVVAQEELWKLIWMFRTTPDMEQFKVVVTDIFSRVLYAGAFPYAYIHLKFPAESKRRSLADHPSWLLEAALLDGLLAHQIIQEINRTAPVAASVDKLNTLTNLCWNLQYNIPQHYTTHPIDREFLREMNEGLAAREGAVLRLDVGVENYIIAGMHLQNIAALNELAHQFNIYPKYFIAIDEKEELALKETAVAIEEDIRYNKCRGLLPYRDHTVQLWNYLYHELGDVAYWQEWLTSLRDALANKYPLVGTKVEAADFDFWWEWYKKCSTILNECDIAIPGKSE
jgi:hypothetical protein